MTVRRPFTATIRMPGQLRGKRVLGPTHETRASLAIELEATMIEPICPVGAISTIYYTGGGYSDCCWYVVKISRSRCLSHRRLTTTDPNPEWQQLRKALARFNKSRAAQLAINRVKYLATYRARREERPPTLDPRQHGFDGAYE